MPSWKPTAEANLRIFYRQEPLGADTMKAYRERLAISRAAAANSGYQVIEMVRLGVLPQEQALKMVVEAEGLEHLRAATEAGHGAIVLGLHYGNWELAGAYVSSKGFILNAVGKEQRDDFATRLLFSWRSRYGTRNIFAGDSTSTAVLRTLRDGQVLVLTADQNGGPGGVFAPFAGTLASTVKGPAVLALRTGAPLIVAYSHRLSPGRMRFVAQPPLDTSGIPGHDPATGKYTDEAVVELLTRINRTFEQIIRADPTQWLWSQKRWRTRPEGEPRLYS